MNQTPQIDLTAETSLAGYEIALIALAVVIALGFLFRGLWRRRRAASPACNTCPGCATGGTCEAVNYDFSEPETGARK
ncbi:hypothetical protein RGUI_2487 [Rhodovulum sp. P5]|uniref:FeoB-associated Cys-rich membrane protein n=1 Tax=Rhodovulum sp. P5 TaxID=1564506 RepID=UPI0009C1CAD1|nr:FeoB-associated Cys-rich membrane protein [Rhodovulum sp. P5]ARE40628.1 hypothetical protein RGUI_2487 [Rhodovulum sp. P5]